MIDVQNVVLPHLPGLLSSNNDRSDEMVHLTVFKMLTVFKFLAVLLNSPYGHHTVKPFESLESFKSCLRPTRLPYYTVSRA